MVLAFVYNVHRHWFINDDAFITFRYSHNLLALGAPIYNPGELVEGYTNFLWMLMMAAGMAVGLDPVPLSLGIGAASGLATLGLLAWFSARQLPTGWRSPFVWVAPALLAVSRTYTAWCSGGLGTSFFTLLITGAAVALVVERERPERTPWISVCLLIVASLTRPEGGLFTFVVGSVLLAEVAAKRLRLRQLVLWCAPYISLIGAHLLWRHWYYGWWLPNTFYVKVNGLWLQHSVKWFSLIQADYAVLYYLWLLPLAVLVFRRYAHLLFAALLLEHLAYLTYVGGDRFEFRLLHFALPVGYWLLAEGLRVVAVRVPRLGPALAVAACASLLCVTQLLPLRTEHVKPRSGTASLHSMRAYAERRITEGKLLGALVASGQLPDDLVLATGGAGAMPYYAGLVTIDFRGLNDAQIGHRELRKRGRIGHEKHGTMRYLRQRGVGIFDVRAQGLIERGPPRYKVVKDVVKRAKMHDRGRGWVVPKCLVFDGGYLAFATLLSAADFEASLGRLSPCELDLDAVRDNLPSRKAMKQRRKVRKRRKQRLQHERH